MRIAFYKGKGNWIDRVIRWRTKSIYSHCELIFNAWFSSSPRDGGVRFKRIEPDPNAWDFADIGGSPGERDEAIVRATWIEGRKYDFIGAIFGAGLGLSVELPKRFFCVEAIAYALKGYIDLPSSASPQKLYETLKKRGAA